MNTISMNRTSVEMIRIKRIDKKRIDKKRVDKDNDKDHRDEVGSGRGPSGVCAPRRGRE
jgi:hypothetical protein